jgi:mannitol/fructose-specific phosphotransferase system IIA component (Ntr-type)/Kef-type K+ transport system membrane component KefB
MRASPIRHLLVCAAIVCTAPGLQAATAPTAVPEAHPMASFLLLLGILIAAARLGALAVEAIGLPALVGEVGAGMLFGNALLGRLPLPGHPGGLQGSADRFLEPQGAFLTVVLCALLSLLFTVGLETDIRLLRRGRPEGIWIGLCGALGSLLCCGAVIHTLGPRLALGQEIQLGSPIGIYLCVAALFSSASLAARTLARMRKLDSPEGLGLSSAAVADRLAAMVILALAASALALWKQDPGQTSPAFFARAIIRAVAVALPVGLLCWTVSRRLNLAPRARIRFAGIASLLPAAVMMVMGLVSHSGLALLAAAFLCGLTLAGSDWRQAVQERTAFLQAAFTPVCFALLGMRLDVSRLNTPSTWTFAAFLLAAAVGGKLAGSWLPARAAGYNTRGWLRIGLGLMPRGEVALAIAALGVFTGILTPPALAVIILLVLVTSTAASPLLAWAFGGDRTGVRVSFPARPPRQLRFTFMSASATRALLQRLIDVLETEGFHVQLLNRHAAIYQLNKDRSVIGLRPEGMTLIVDCAEEDQTLVNSAMLEVLAGIEQHLRELRRPLDAIELSRHVVRETVPGRAQGKPPAGLIDINTLRPRLLADTKAAAISELIEMLDDEGLISDRMEALGAVIAREEGMSTGIENGIAMPHARTRAVDRLVCAVGLKPEGIDFGTLDNRPVRIVILLLAPVDLPAPQLQAIAYFIRILNEQGRAALLACDSAEDMVEILRGAAALPGRQAAANPAPENPLACLQWHSVSLDLHASTKEAVIDQLLALCARSGVVTDLAEARTAILARENKSSTGLEHGIALPHARTEAVSHMVCALGISRAGVDFGSLDGQPSAIFIMVLMPLEITTAYTRLTGGLMRALDEAGRQALLAAKSGSEAVGILARGLAEKAKKR